VGRGENALVVFVADGEAQVARLIEVAGVRVSNVHVHRPTLDDVFLHFTGRQIREDHGAHVMPMRMRAMARRH
jgi:ABC-2 type transport system ATP-binding protein